MPELSLLQPFDLLLVPPIGLTSLETEGKGVPWMQSRERGASKGKSTAEKG